METNGPAVDLLSGIGSWYYGVFTDTDIGILQDRTRERQRAAFEALRASGKSLLVKSVKKRDSVLK